MNRPGSFFERRGFACGAGKPYYRYLGYRRRGNGDYPVSLHFGRDEMFFSYHATDGRAWRVFSLYVAEGGLNQGMLADKIKAYWKEPEWDVSLAEYKNKKTSENKKYQLESRMLAKRGYFRLLFPDAGKESGESIDFRRLMLEFLFELEFTSTFEDENFFRLQPVIQNNLLLDALTRKCLYLKRRAAEEAPHGGRSLSKPFRKSEEAWLKVCFQECYLPVFTAVDSVFATVEKEVAAVVFDTRIGAGRKTRRQLFSDKDVNLRNQAATFFLRRYSIINAFKILLPPAALILVPAFLLLIPFGDLLFSIVPNLLAGGNLAWQEGNTLTMWYPVPLWAYAAPLLAGAGGVIFYWLRSINLFKLMLPRMFFGVLVGWSVFWTTEEMWKSAVTATARNGCVFSLVLLLLILMYVFTDIRNRLVRVSGAVVFGRALSLVGFATLMSLILGFYAIQFKAGAMLADSGFLTCDNAALLSLDERTCVQISGADCQCLGRMHDVPRQAKEMDDDKLKLLTYQTTFRGHNYMKLQGADKLKWPMSYLKYGARGKQFTLRYIWSVLLGQTMMSILAGMILQLLWEDRPITEPL